MIAALISYIYESAEIVIYCVKYLKDFTNQSKSILYLMLDHKFDRPHGTAILPVLGPISIS